MITNIKNIDVRRIRKKGTKKPVSVKQTINNSSFEKSSFYNNLLEDCVMYWEGLRDFYERRQRSVDYYRGKQLNDIVVDPDTEQTMTESDYIKKQGKIPYIQNLIRQTGKNVIGQYISTPTDPLVLAREKADSSITDMMNNAIRYVADINNSKELDIRNFEEFFISGMAVSKIGYQYIKERDMEDVRYSNVNPNRIFFNNNISDIRFTDLRIIGELIDTTIENVVAAFAKTKEDEEVIRALFTQSEEFDGGNDTFSGEDIKNLDFFIPSNTNMVRLIEVWYLKSEWRVYAHDYADGSYQIVDYTMKEIADINKQRILMGAANGIPPEEIALVEAEQKYEAVWHYAFLTPTGVCLAEGETPYEHQSHPYVIIAHPMIDGMVWGFVEDIIPQNRYINRLIMLQDFIMGASAKGVLLVPETAIEDDSDLDRYAEEWTKFNGVIKYKVKKGYENLVPKQVSSNSTNIGLNDMLSLQLKLFEEVAGVSSALKGETPSSGTPASLYMAQAQNSMTNLSDIMTNFKWFKQQRDFKVLKLIKQYYTEPRYLAIAGKGYKDEAMMYQPALVKDMEFDLVMTESKDTPVFRSMTEDFLMRLLEGGMINLEMLLEQSSMPLADKMLESIRRQKEKLQDPNAPAQGVDIPPELQQAAASGDPKAQEVVQQLMAGMQQN